MSVPGLALANNNPAPEVADYRNANTQDDSVGDTSGKLCYLLFHDATYAVGRSNHSLSMSDARGSLLYRLSAQQLTRPILVVSTTRKQGDRDDFPSGGNF